MEDNILRKHGLKSTNARIKILNLLNKTDHPISADELYKIVKSDKIDFSTVYRTLSTFEAKNIVKKEISQNKINVYSLNNDKDCHYLVCVKCHKRIKLDFCPFHELHEEIEKQTGFELFDQNTEIYGICEDCK